MRGRRCEFEDGAVCIRSRLLGLWAKRRLVAVAAAAVAAARASAQSAARFPAAATSASAAATPAAVASAGAGATSATIAAAAALLSILWTVGRPCRVCRRSTSVRKVPRRWSLCRLCSRVHISAAIASSESGFSAQATAEHSGTTAATTPNSVRDTWTPAHTPRRSVRLSFGRGILHWARWLASRATFRVTGRRYYGQASALFERPAHVRDGDRRNVLDWHPVRGREYRVGVLFRRSQSGERRFGGPCSQRHLHQL